MAHECSALDALGGELLNPCLEVSFGFGAKPLLILRDAKNAIGVGRERRLNRDHVNQANFCGRSLRWHEGDISRRYSAGFIRGYGLLGLLSVQVASWESLRFTVIR